MVTAQPPHLLVAVGCVEGQVARHHGKGDHPKGPHVYGGALVQAARHDLRRCVARRAAVHAQLLARLVEGRQPKVYDLHGGVAVQQDVLQLDVAVDHLAGGVGVSCWNGVVVVVVVSKNGGGWCMVHGAQ